MLDRCARLLLHCAPPLRGRPLFGCVERQLLGGEFCLLNVAKWPILLKNSVPADGRKNLALIGREARSDVEDHKEILITHPSVLSRF